MTEATTSQVLNEIELANLRSVTDVLQYWNRQDIEGVLGYYDDSIIWLNIAMEETYRGKGEVRVFLRKLFAAFPDLSFEVTYKIARGDNVAEQWLIRGTHLGTFMGIPSTGRHVEIPGMSMAELRNARFVSDHFYFDALGVLRDMALMPPLSVSQTLVGRGALGMGVAASRLARALVRAIQSRR
ncbi:MAG TPA: ester cyclase [Chloroflexota bacterium]|nr:ester cyclase [Chloroflexota bacterium]